MFTMTPSGLEKKCFRDMMSRGGCVVLGFEQYLKYASVAMYSAQPKNLFICKVSIAPSKGDASHAEK